MSEKIRTIWNTFKKMVKFPIDVLFYPRAAKEFLTNWEVIQQKTVFFRVAQKTNEKICRKQLNVNIGCGDGWHHEGWLGLDSKKGKAYPNKKNAKSGFDLDYDILEGLPFETGTVNCIFMSHILEHFTYNESLFVLRECYRVLKIGGRIRLVVPDLDLYISKYSVSDKTFFSNKSILGGFPLGNVTDSFLMLFYSDPSLNNSCHKYAYNLENLTYRLKQCSFKNIEKSSHMKSKWTDLNHHDFDSSNKEVPSFSLYVEAEK